jgi:hypothetical protein
VRALLNELTLLWLRGSKLCLTMVGALLQGPLHKGMRFVVAHYTGVAMRLLVLWAVVFSAVQSMLRCLPIEVLQADVVVEMVAMFQEQVERWSCLKTSGSGVCDHILGPADDQVHMAIRLEVSIGQLQVMQDEHRALQSSATRV